MGRDSLYDVKHLLVISYSYSSLYFSGSVLIVGGYELLCFFLLVLLRIRRWCSLVLAKGDSEQNYM